MMPAVSAIIPAFNAAGYIEACIESVLRQTLQSIEIIVVDDGSGDATADVVRSIRDPRIRLLHQEHRGQSAALNRGAGAATGQYMKFLDADDWLNEEHLSSQLAALEGFGESVASCRWRYFVDDPGSTNPAVETVHRNYDDPLEWLVDSLTLDEGMMGGWMWLIPRGVWERAGGWDERLTLNNDFDFSVRLLLASDGVRFAPHAIYSYRKGVGGALNARRESAAMLSAFLTTESGCERLLNRENSPRIRKICADRWQYWLHQFYPEHSALAADAERRITMLGGSSVRLEGGSILRMLLPVLGWKRVRRLQVRAYQNGWNAILELKSRRRIGKLESD